MNYCSNCGAVVSADAQSCPRCRVVFRGFGKGSTAELTELGHAYKQSVAADRKRNRQDRRWQRFQEMRRGHDRKWRRVTRRNTEALAALTAFCVTVQRADRPHRAIDVWAGDIAWLRTPPSERRPEANPDFLPTGRQWLLGPRTLKYPTRKVIRYVEDAIIRTECNPVLRDLDLDHAARALKGQLDLLVR
jgi:hypothetical protein